MKKAFMRNFILITDKCHYFIQIIHGILPLKKYFACTTY